MSKKIKLSLLGMGILCLVSCVATKNQSEKELKFIDPNTYQLYEVAKNASYAYTSQEPVKVGGQAKNEGRLNARRYLNALLGANGEKITYKLLKSCCYEKIKNNDGTTHLIFLDQYELYTEGTKRRSTIFVSTFEEAEMLAPKGFTFKIKKIKE